MVSSVTAGIEKGVARKQVVHSTNQVSRRLRLEDYALSADSLDVSGKFSWLVHRKHEHPTTQMHIRNPRRNLQTVNFGHRNVQDHNIGQEGLSQFNSLFSVPGLATNHPFRSRSSDQLANALAHDLMVIDDQNPYRHARSVA